MASLFPLKSFTILALTSALLLSPALAQTTCATISPKYAPVVTAGYTAKVLMNGLTAPRGMLFDSQGNLLIVEQGGAGVRLVKLTHGDGINVCVASSKQLINDPSLNHGIQLTGDGKTLFVSSETIVYSYTYDATAGTVRAKKTVITGLSPSGHATRTLLISKQNPDQILVQVGSNANIDSATTEASSGRSQARIFSINALKAGTSSVAYTTGTLFAWGLRNSIGWAEEPTTGGIWSNENSLDDAKRNGVDVHMNNPGEELNYHGVLNDTKSPQFGANYGYPLCIAARDPTILPANTKIQIGTQFVYGTVGGINTDDLCAPKQAPRLTFPAHTAPIDLKFNTNGSALYVTFHGSWDRQPPDGYRMSRVDFKNGQPLRPANSANPAVNILTNADNTKCPNDCFRPSGLAWDSKNRLYMASDSTGEVFVISGA
ncbi:hypothetical protein BGZ57DRAFT_949007 [Hyaloscypha finlandica]|nr:hypothetical protein BGZ57DRAFT_949007 [Hyaloscypha finlandica]